MFDSGFGGLTVARAAIDLLPFEDLVYLGDTGRYPYGPRPLDEVRGFAHQIARRLIDEHDVKLLVVACNTASAAALTELQEELPIRRLADRHVLKPEIVRGRRTDRPGGKHYSPIDEG